ncbi:dihydropteroate synthase [Nocardioides daejeonensis]|uniref:dihydropteroate synthase n=1 Tax=Nocardioides daejeonensis TaxID=1046556 RepID=UPI000D745191|nr:dihydropteroate synthase [Nocardioides daejeonensis]
MITLAGLAALAAEHGEELRHPVAPFQLAGRSFDTDTEPLLMGVVNLSRDSSYRESIAVSIDSAVRKGRVQAAEGAHLIDVGAESSRASAARLTAPEQLRTLVPVIEQLAADGIAVSIESYEPSVVRAALKAGAALLNLTGSQSDDEMFALAAEYDASIVLCHVLGPHARALDGSDVDPDPVPGMLEGFAPRIERAREIGVRDIAIDPGMGFGFRLDDQRARASHQATTLLNSFRLRRLGVPICHALPHAFDFFEDQFRSGEGFFAMLAHLGGTGIYRTHEVPLTRAVLDALHHFTVEPPRS